MILHGQLKVGQRNCDESRHDEQDKEDYEEDGVDRVHLHKRSRHLSFSWKNEIQCRYQGHASAKKRRGCSSRINIRNATSLALQVANTAACLDRERRCAA